MTEPLALGEKLLSLLEESARTTTYKPALLLAMIDRAPEHLDGRLPVRDLAERVIELYWPQTLAYPTTGAVLRQGTKQATIVQELVGYRERHKVGLRALPESWRQGEEWDLVVTRVEHTLAEWPVPRLQRPFDPFLYDFDWSWAEEGGWAVRRYKQGSRAIQLFPGVADALISLGPLLRPFITRWWTDKAAKLNPDVEAAQSVIEFEDFLFGRDRQALERIAESLLDLQAGACFYCESRVTRNREIDHFVPWSRSGDDGLDNLVAACRRCNNDKRATLPAAKHLDALLRRNALWDRDLASIATERQWPRNRPRTLAVIRTAYLTGSGERSLWRWDPTSSRPVLASLTSEHPQLVALLSNKM